MPIEYIERVDNHIDDIEIVGRTRSAVEQGAGTW
jgi:hypothetical protein